MARLQLALDVADLESAVEFYTCLFDTPPHKRREGYANFAIADPPLKLVLFERGEQGTAINHLGVEVEDTEAVEAAGARFAAAGLQTRDSMAELCCHAVQDKVFATDPNGGEWEFYTILDDQPEAAEPDACTADACGVEVRTSSAELPLAGASSCC